MNPDSESYQRMRAPRRFEAEARARFEARHGAVPDGWMTWSKGIAATALAVLLLVANNIRQIEQPTDRPVEPSLASLSLAVLTVPSRPGMDGLTAEVATTGEIALMSPSRLRLAGLSVSSIANTPVSYRRATENYRNSQGGDLNYEPH